MTSILDTIPDGSWTNLSTLTTEQKIFVFNCYDCKPIVGLNQDFVDNMLFVQKKLIENDVYSTGYRRKRLSMVQEKEIVFDDLFNLFLQINGF